MNAKADCKHRHNCALKTAHAQYSQPWMLGSKVFKQLLQFAHQKTDKRAK